MKIALLIENLGSGGAERQLCTLALEFQQRGHDVRIVTYSSGNFYSPTADNHCLQNFTLPGKTRFERILSVRRYLRESDQDVVLAFLQGPCVYAELASLPSRRWGLVVSERVAVPQASKKLAFQRMLHLLADFVITNSHANRLLIEHAVHRLRGKVATIYNAVDLEQFRPNVGESCTNGALRFVVASSYQHRKNMVGLIESIALLKREMPKTTLIVDWYGDVLPDNKIDLENAVQLAHQLKIDDRFRLNPATRNIIAEYQNADAVVLASFYEGLPNTICEAMACGKPVLMSAVCDAGNLVKEGINGFLFDPFSPPSIAEAIKKFVCLSQENRRALGMCGRKMAESLFDVKVVADRYLEVLHAAAKREKIKIFHDDANIPETAHKMMPR